MSPVENQCFTELLQLAREKEALNCPAEDIIFSYIEASNACPMRAEALHGAARYCRMKGLCERGYKFARQGLAILRPNSLPIENWIYEYGLLDELSVNAYWVGAYRECVDACDKMLASEVLPGAMRERVLANKDFAVERLLEEDRFGSKIVHRNSRVKLAKTEGLPINICNITYNDHDAVYYDMIRCIHGSTIDLGYECSITRNSFKPGAINIIIGMLVAAAQDWERIKFITKGPFIVYNLEQLNATKRSSQWPGYFKLLELASVILEYSPTGLRFLESTTLSTKSVFLPPRFHRSMEFFRPKKERDIDVLFYGSHTGRRQHIVEGIRSAGFKVIHLFGEYEDTLIDHIRRSKIILNLHHYDAYNTLETVRIVPLLSNKCFCISEQSDHNPFGGGVIYSGYDDIINCCIKM